MADQTHPDIARQILAGLNGSALRDPATAGTVASVHIGLALFEELRKLQEAVDDLTTEVHKLAERGCECGNVQEWLRRTA